ncbi:hypothetical protein GPECTOR_32g524 [Gonium pectorale]|uniref:protein-tyrosine-phosphatase n=1 Tax=Gonium pectorale TaxID=33097 RepID=A0A150GDH8_GONPE|nr:hypothetical protein GPECTOR_32g524 [Gonium pectorale]|eukprot:KXZ47911.1 hypothetical protein GPECTOR_32g524 [Gonium pectorale]
MGRSSRWGRNVLVYGDSELRKDHPVVRFLAAQGKCASLHMYKDGFEAFARVYPFLCTPSVKQMSIKKYPSQIVPGLLYLGDWDNAADTERLEELRIRRILTIHNHPEKLRPPPGVRHLRQELPDIEDADIAGCFAEAFDFIDEAREKGQAVLVHCGAGVSRSATLVVMYLMRHHAWSAARARAHVVSRRSAVCLNDGFWRTLCGLEAALGIAERSDPNATSGFRGADAPGGGRGGDGPDSEDGGRLARGAVAVSKDAAGGRVPVRMLGPKEAQEAGGKRGRGEEGSVEGGAEKRARTAGSGSGGGVVLRFEVRKPEGLVGVLEVGPLRPGQRCVLGRQPDCDVVLEHASISRQHAALTVDRGGAVSLTDLQSGHGTKVGDTWLRPNAPRQLSALAALRFGASTRSYTLTAISKE